MKEVIREQPKTISIYLSVTLSSLVSEETERKWFIFNIAIIIQLIYILVNDNG